MKRIAAFLLLVFLVAGCATPMSALQRAHGATMRLDMDGTRVCSGTAIGPHAILSATHCFIGAQTLAINGTPAAVLGATSDGHDHTILIVDHTFTEYAGRGKVSMQGDPVFIFGNAAGLFDMFRAGHFAGIMVEGSARKLLYDLNDFPGDSGGGIFDANGRLVGVVSQFLAFEDRGARIQFTVAFDLAFTPAQWARASEVDRGIPSS